MKRLGGGGARPAQQEEAHLHASPHPPELMCTFCRVARFGIRAKSLTELFKSFTSGHSSGEKQLGVQTQTRNTPPCMK